MGQPLKELSTCMKVIRITMIVTLLIYSIVTLALAIVSYSSLEENITIVTDIVRNWNKNAIIDIQASYTGSCAAGYEPAF
jgi:hypothetical protein